jgi:1-acyl-sn-glycerol-3-phosphate acyltransferase
MTMSREPKPLSLAWGLWFNFWVGVLTFFGGILAILSTFLDPRGSLSHLVGRWWARTLLFVGRIPVKVSGLEYLAPGQTYVFAANHRSNVDIFALFAVLPGRFLWVAKKELFKIPIFGQALHRMGSVPIDRDNLPAAIRSLNHAAAKVRAGTSMIIFPEGTRVPKPALQPFKKGVLIMAWKAGQPLVPVSINGTFFIQPRGALRMRPGPVKVILGPPIYPQNFRRQEELMNAVWHGIAANYDPDFPYGPAAADG